MKSINISITLSTIMLCSFIFASFAVQAHLMKAQHGTLNFKDNGVYMVLSIPATAFNEIDTDKDNLLSMHEFSENRAVMISIIEQNISLTSDNRTIPLQGILLSPVTPHDAPNEPAARVVVMGKFLLSESDGELQFGVELFNQEDHNGSLTITASRKSENQKQVFELSRESNRAKLSFI